MNMIIHSNCVDCCTCMLPVPRCSLHVQLCSTFKIKRMLLYMWPLEIRYNASTCLAALQPQSPQLDCMTVSGGVLYSVIALMGSRWQSSDDVWVFWMH